ncbi:MAG: GAF domain-containing protein [Anaerolineae bacterium]|nr:GAF domain-containing protein [Anaerolineae bacterium]
MANILYIDQDELSQQFVQSQLDASHTVIAAYDGPTAIQYSAMIQPDIILMNLALPDIEGPELAARLKMFMPQTPILLVLNSDTIELEGAHLEIDFAGTLKKPIDLPSLNHHIESLLASQTASASQSAAAQFELQIAALTQANKRLASLNTISALIGTSLDLEHLFDEILSQINKIIAFDSATLFLLKGNILEAAASRGLSGYRRGMNTFQRNEHNSAWWVVQNKLPMIIADVTKSDYWESRPELEAVKSWLGIPLIYTERVVGVLTLDKNEAAAFGDADARYLFTLAYQIAIAVENVQLFEAWEAQSTRLKLINEVSKEINSVLNAEDLFFTLGREIFNKLTYDQVLIFWVDEARTSLVLKALFGQPAPQLKIDHFQLPLDFGLIGDAIREERPLFTNQVALSTKAVVQSPGIQSRLISPIFIDNQIEAVIDVGRSVTNGFNDQDLWVLSSLSSQAATVLENARLYREVRIYSTKLERTVSARTNRLQALQKISQVVSQGLEADELLTVVGRGIGQIFAASAADEARVDVGLLQGGTINLEAIYPAHQPPENTLKETTGLSPIDPDDPIGYVITRAKPIIINNESAGQGRSTLATKSSSDAQILAPLIAGGKTFGVIRVTRSASDVFDEGDLEILAMLALQIASAIEHARLVHKSREIAIVEERTRLARDMHDGVAQNLAYLMLQVDRCINMVEGGSRLETLLEKISNLLAQNIDELRRNIFDLRPVGLDGKPLSHVLKTFVAEFGQRWGVRTEYRVEAEVSRHLLESDLLPEVESSLYRILQETLSNAHQHAHCTELSVQLSIEDERWIALTIQDNGHGFDENTIKNSDVKNRGLGLVSMRERAEQLGGQLLIDSTIGQGTRVIARLPLHTWNKSESGKITV